MPATNFTLLTDEQKTIWSMDLWKQARTYSFINKFLGKDSNALVQHITELKKSEKGARAVITLLADLEGDGVTGDSWLEGNEEPGKSYDQVIRIDQLRHAQRHEGRMADQKSIVEFRNNAKDSLAWWLADRIDQIAFLTMSGVSYSMHNTGIPRIGSNLTSLEFAADVTAPTAKRKMRWNGTSKTLEENGATSAVTATDLPMWELFVQLRAQAKVQRMRGVKSPGGNETYHVFLTPQAMAKLKLDPTYMQNVRNSRQRSSENPLFTGDAIEIDGIVFHDYIHVYNTSGAASGSKWGASGTVDGCQMLFCGAQALAMADLGNPEWVEKSFDFDNQQAISTSKIFGFLKPRFNSIYAGNTVQDFGVISVYVAQ